MGWKICKPRVIIARVRELITSGYLGIQSLWKSVGTRSITRIFSDFLKMFYFYFHEKLAGNVPPAPDSATKKYER